jgi:agmatinase
MDLRERYEGFKYSHASITHNAIAETPNLERVVMIGIRDYGMRENQAAENSGGKVRPRFDLNWRTRMDRGDTLTKLCAEAIEALPKLVYITFDIDGLDPALCPHTGTPVPGGLSFNETCILLDTLRRSGRRVIGFDLCEVCPPPPDHRGHVNEWDANVGARILYKLAGVAASTSR